MTAALFAMPTHKRPGVLLVAGIVLATLTEAIASTVLSLGRVDIIGDTYATPDEFAWLDVGYTAPKLIGFMAAAWLMNRIKPHSLIVGSALVMGAACAIAAITARLDLLVLLRVMQGFSGGILLVAGQAIIFLAYPRRHQPILQALFAIGSVVAPATIAPALQGWLLDSQSWTWIFFSVVPVSLAAAGLLLLADCPAPVKVARRPFDWIGFSLVVYHTLLLHLCVQPGQPMGLVRGIPHPVADSDRHGRAAGVYRPTGDGQRPGPAGFHLVPVGGFLLRVHRQFRRRRRLVRERVPDSVVRRVRPCIHANRRRPAPVAERRAFHRRPSHSLLSSCRSAVFLRSPRCPLES